MDREPVRYVALAFALAQALVGVAIAISQDSKLIAALGVLAAVLTQAAAEISRTKVTPMETVRDISPEVARTIELGAK